MCIYWTLLDTFLSFVQLLLVWCGKSYLVERVVPSCSQYYHGSPIYTQVTMERLKMQSLTRLLAATSFKFKIKVSLRSQSRDFPFKINTEVAMYIVCMCTYTLPVKSLETHLFLFFKTIHIVEQGCPKCGQRVKIGPHYAASLMANALCCVSGLSIVAKHVIVNSPYILHPKNWFVSVGKANYSM